MGGIFVFGSAIRANHNITPLLNIGFFYSYLPPTFCRMIAGFVSRRKLFLEIAKRNDF
jgi:hypothetical protein